MFVGSCGFGSTGSSAVTDYVKEFDSFKVMDSLEFGWISAVDGLIDLDYYVNCPHTRTMGSFTAIERFRRLCLRFSGKLEALGLPRGVFMEEVESFIDSIVDVSWAWYRPAGVGTSGYRQLLRRVLDKTGIIRRWEIKNGRHWEGYPFERVQLSVKPADFDELARGFVRDVLTAIGAVSDRPVIMDQPFPGNNPQSCFKYLDDPYAIVVDRDPRDNYTFAKTKLLTKSSSHLMPVNDVRDFVRYYRALRDGQPYKEYNPRVLRVQFEDLVYHYEETTARIREFLHLGRNPNPKSIFDPALSMPNTQVWRRFPQFEQDVRYIERELAEYLFDYTGCPVPDPNGKMFVGRSPRNKI